MSGLKMPSYVTELHGRNKPSDSLLLKQSFNLQCLCLKLLSIKVLLTSLIFADYIVYHGNICMRES